MAIFNQLPDDFIRSEFTHYGLVCGIVPVYVAFNGVEPSLAVMNWCPEFVFDPVVGAYSFLTFWLDDNSIPIHIINEI